MKLNNIVEALNRYHSKKFPESKGWFIGTESIEPTKVNVYKKYKAEIFYHTPGKNHRVYTQQLIDRCPEGYEDVLKEKMMIAILADLFENIQEINKYETV